MSAKTARKDPVTRLMESLTPIFFSVFGAVGGVMLVMSLLGHAVHNDVTASPEMKGALASFPKDSIFVSVAFLATIFAMAVVFAWRQFFRRSA